VLWSRSVGAMTHGLDEFEQPAPVATGLPQRIWDGLNQVVVIVSAVALVVASCVLTYSVATRYYLHYSTDWQDEFSVFLIVGAVFMSAASVQARRGHVAIEAVSVLLPKRVNHVRLLLVDIASLAFCAYFTWKSWVLLDEAIVDNFHSSSTWGPPLWIPYSLMTAGMALLSVQLALQIAAGLRHGSSVR
jgi:TRAP-type C4-dicarboxylate transport system permease small subunit